MACLQERTPGLVTERKRQQEPLNADTALDSLKRYDVNAWLVIGDELERLRRALELIANGGYGDASVKARRALTDA